MELPEVEAVVGRLYLAVLELQKQNTQLKEIVEASASISGNKDAS